MQLLGNILRLVFTIPLRSFSARDVTLLANNRGLESWTASSSLTQFKHMTQKQLSDQITITLKPKGRATFVDISYCEDGAFHRVPLPESSFSGEKLGDDDKPDFISYFNGRAKDNAQSPVVEAQVEVEAQLCEVPLEEREELLDDIRKPKKARRKAAAS